MIARRTVLTVVLLLWVPLPLFGQATVQGQVRVAGSLAPGAVVYLVPVNGTSPSMAPDTATIDQLHLRFVPEVLPIRIGTTVEFLNSDPIMHNVFSPARSGAGFDLGTYPQGDRRLYTFSAEGVYLLLCHVHPEMAAWIVVVPTPYFAVSNDEGAYRLQDVPPGTYKLLGWHRRGMLEEQLVQVLPGERRVRVSVGGSSRSQGR